MELSINKRILRFKFDAGTSRGILKEKPAWILTIKNDSIIGTGECSPLEGLSIESLESVESRLLEIQKRISSCKAPANQKEAFQLAHELTGHEYPSLKFALETAFLDLIHGGGYKIFNNKFYYGEQNIPINGLVWMGNYEFMKRQIDEKPGVGYGCLKMKIGAINTEEEIRLIAYMRSKYPDITIRLDANGAFDYDSAMDVLKKVKDYNIHSIEQPLRQKQPEVMKKLCADSPVPVALDEELIGIYTIEEKLELLKELRPQFVILKPTLLGGYSQCGEWITLAKKLNIGWWITSALESNIGLNAIAQYTAEVRAESFQGLGTGQLFENNFPSPLTIKNGCLFYDPHKSWN